jgi:hypothetical protein
MKSTTKAKTTTKPKKKKNQHGNNFLKQERRLKCEMTRLQFYSDQKTTEQESRKPNPQEFFFHF